MAPLYIRISHRLTVLSIRARRRQNFLRLMSQRRTQEMAMAYTPIPSPSILFGVRVE